MTQRHPRPSAKQIRDSFEQPTIWPARVRDAAADPAAVFLRALQPERKAA